MKWVTLMDINKPLQEPLRDWFVYGLVPASGVVALVGDHGVGTSFVTFDLAARLASGSRQWMGHKLKGSSNVVYICTDKCALMVSRVLAWLEANDRQSIDGFYFAFCDYPKEKDVCEFIANVITQMSGHDKVLVIDSLEVLCARFGDSKRKHEVVRMLAQMDLCVILVDYLEPGVVGFPTIYNVEAYDLLAYTADSVLAIHSPYRNDIARCLSVLKTRDVDPNRFPPIKFRMEKVDTGRVDNFGQSASSLVPVYVSALQGDQP